MSQFSNQLQACIDARGLSQTEVCEKAGIAQGTLSRYVNGENRPPPDAFETLAKAFPAEDRKALLLAYVADCIPAGMRGLIEITPRTPSRVSEEPPVYRSRMPRQLREAYDGLGTKILDDAEVADTIVALWKIVRAHQ